MIYLLLQTVAVSIFSHTLAALCFTALSYPNFYYYFAYRCDHNTGCVRTSFSTWTIQYVCAFDFLQTACDMECCWDRQYDFVCIFVTGTFIPSFSKYLHFYDSKISLKHRLAQGGLPAVFNLRICFVHFFPFPLCSLYH